MNNVAIAFCSIRPGQIPENLAKCREALYLSCLRQIARITPKSFVIRVFENTVLNSSSITCPELRSLLSSMGTVYISGNKGAVNKGVGELDMLTKAIALGAVQDAGKVAYLTGSKFHTCPYFLEHVESMQTQALISNPDFVYVHDGHAEKTCKEGMYNDMAFAMDKDTIIKYSSYFIQNEDKMIRDSIGSEQLLYRFISENGVSYTWLEHLGIVRYDWQRDPINNVRDVNNYQIC